MAFLSYSHQDAAIADWLHEELEEFRVPPRLIGKLTDHGPVPKRLAPIFRHLQGRRVVPCSHRARIHAQHPRRPCGADVFVPPIRHGLQHGDVLLDRREAHGVSLREPRDGRFAGGAATQDVATGRVRERVEQLVDRLVAYNHMVVGYLT